jgi:hypothetical protein
VAYADSIPAQPLGRRLASLIRRQALRPRVFVFRGRLDRELASGVDPASRPALTVRAEQLLRPRYRRRLATSVERLIEELDAGAAYRLSAAVPFLRDEVAEARGSLLSLAGALRDTQPVGPRGVAMVSKLITDPASPLYTRADRGALKLEAHAALEHLLAGCEPWCELPAAPPFPGQDIS